VTRPDSGPPDQSANQEDAVWLDLVARLEATPTADSDATGAGPVVGPHAAGPDTPPEAPGRTSSFSDFDPLGLAGTAPTELSAAERQAGAPPAGDRGQADAGEDAGSYGQGGATPTGPRDYGVEDDGGDFVPEEPPSLAGTDPLTMLAWLGALGAPVGLLLAAMFWRSAPLLAIVGMVAVFILAVVFLIMKLPQEKDENDDGARV